MIDLEEFQSRITFFPPRYMRNFDYIWKWKINIESNSTNHILNDQHRKETYRRLCKILPRWQTYRNGNNSDPLGTLRDSLNNISEDYSQIKTYTLIDFDNILFECIERIWHELGRVKEYNGNKSKDGYYYIISVCKPLLLIWGQTLAFDSKVRKNVPRSYNVPRYSSRWNLKQWISVMREFSEYLKRDQNCLDVMKKESEKRYGKNTFIPYGRFLDIYYWKGP